MVTLQFTEFDGHALFQQMLQKLQEIGLAGCSFRPSERETPVQNNVVSRYLLAIRERKSAELEAGFTSLLTDYLAGALEGAPNDVDAYHDVDVYRRGLSER